MASQVSLSNFSLSNHIMFRLNYGKLFEVKSFSNGTMTVEPVFGCSIEYLAKSISECFIKNSKLNGLKAIEFEFDGTHVCVDLNSSTPDKIIKLWKKENKKRLLQLEKQHKQYIKTRKYKGERAKELKVNYRKKRVEELVKLSVINEKLQFKDEKAYEFFKDCLKTNSKNEYSLSTICYAIYWAKFMQYLMNKHKNVDISKIAENTSNAADIWKVDMFMYDYALNLLTKVWKYGNQLQNWANRKYDYEGNTTVVPTMLAANVN